MNRVVRETRERVGDHADFNFGFVRVAEFEHSLRNSAQVRIGKRMQPWYSRAGLASRSSRDFLH